MTALVLATVLFGSVLFVKGLGMILGGQKMGQRTIDSLYNRPASIVLWILAVAWTLWEVTKLGPSDFGTFKVPLFVIFAALGVSSIWMLRDYLMVRAFCVITLYFVWWLLKAAYLQPEWTRLFLVTALYVAILKSLYLAIVPWRMRDGLDWLYAKPIRWKCFGGFYAIYGVILFAAASTYHLLG